MRVLGNAKLESETFVMFSLRACLVNLLPTALTMPQSFRQGRVSGHQAG